jgi:hypothetical protein
MAGSCDLDDVVVRDALFTTIKVRQKLHILVFRWMILVLPSE